MHTGARDSGTHGAVAHDAGTQVVRRRYACTPHGWLFSPRARRWGRRWVAATLPVAVLLAAGAVRGETSYLVAWVLISGLYTTPALVVGVGAIRRVAPADRWCWQLWLVGLVLVYAIGCGLLLSLATGWTQLLTFGTVAVLAAMLAFSVALVGVTKSRSGRRNLTLDLTDGAMVVVGIGAIGPLALGDAVIGADAAWFTVPTALCTVALATAVVWSLMLYGRVDHEHHRTTELMGVALASLGALNSMAQLAQGLSGFTLPAAPLLALQAATMAMLLLLPLHLHADAARGLDRLPPQDQVRTRDPMAWFALVVLPIIGFEVWARTPAQPWVLPAGIGAGLIVLALSTHRQRLRASETRHLYDAVAQAAEARRRLLADVVASTDLERHRVAAQLHEQAISSYVALSNHLRSTGVAPYDTTDPRSRALLATRDDLQRQAEALRQLMLAVRPIGSPVDAGRPLTATVRAYVDSLYDTGRAPVVVVDLAEDLALDWTTETVVLRILQEALANVWRHAEARAVAVTVRPHDELGGVEVRVRDDGIGFDPDAVLFASGLASMRTFAAFADGQVHLESQPGAGTEVVAVLGLGASVDGTPHLEPTMTMPAPPWPDGGDVGDDSNPDSSGDSNADSSLDDDASRLPDPSAATLRLVHGGLSSRGRTPDPAR